jgi:hexokinase
MESGQFAKAPRGKIDDIYNKSTVNPTYSLFEKMVSGAYLGGLCGRVLQCAAGKGLFTDKVNAELSELETLETKDVGEFLENPNSQDNVICKSVFEGGEQDRETVYCILEDIVKRAGKLAAINLSAAAIKSGKGKNPEKPICIVAEGTTFYKLKGLKENVEKYLTEYLQNEKGVYTEIVNVDNAALLGAAIAGLTN